MDLHIQHCHQSSYMLTVGSLLAYWYDSIELWLHAPREEPNEPEQYDRCAYSVLRVVSAIGNTCSRIYRANELTGISLWMSWFSYKIHIRLRRHEYRAQPIGHLIVAIEIFF